MKSFKAILFLSSLLLMNTAVFGQTRTEDLSIDVGLDWIDISSRYTYSYKVSSDGTRVPHGPFTITGGENISNYGVSFKASLRASGNAVDGNLNGHVTTSFNMSGGSSRDRMNLTASLSANFADGIPHGRFEAKTVGKIIKGGSAMDESETYYATYKNGILVGSFYDGSNKGSFDDSGRLNGVWTSNSNDSYEFIKGFLVRSSTKYDETPFEEKALATSYAQGRTSETGLFDKGYRVETGEWNLGESFYNRISDDYVWFWKKGGGYDFSQSCNPIEYSYLEKVVYVDDAEFEKVIADIKRSGVCKDVRYDDKIGQRYISQQDRRFYFSSHQTSLFEKEDEAFRRSHAAASIVEFLDLDDVNPSDLSVNTINRIINNDTPADQAEEQYAKSLASLNKVKELLDLTSPLIKLTSDSQYYVKGVLGYDYRQEKDCVKWSGRFMTVSAMKEYEQVSDLLLNYDPSLFKARETEQVLKAQQKVLDLIPNGVIYGYPDCFTPKDIPALKSLLEPFGQISKCTIESVEPSKVNDRESIVTCLITSENEYYPKQYRARLSFVKVSSTISKLLIGSVNFKEAVYLIKRENLEKLVSVIGDNSKMIGNSGYEEIINQYDGYINDQELGISSDYIKTENRLEDIIRTQKQCLAFIRQRKLIEAQDAQVREKCKYKALLKAYKNYIDKAPEYQSELTWTSGKTTAYLNAVADMQNGILQALGNEKGAIYEQRVKANGKTSILEMFTRDGSGNYAIDSMYTPKELKAKK